MENKTTWWTASEWRAREREICDAEASLWAGLVLRVSQRVGVGWSAEPSGFMF